MYGSIDDCVPTLGPRDPLVRDNPSPYETTGRRRHNMDSLWTHQPFTLRPEGKGGNKDTYLVGN